MQTGHQRVDITLTQHRNQAQLGFGLADKFDRRIFQLLEKAVAVLGIFGDTRADSADQSEALFEANLGFNRHILQQGERAGGDLCGVSQTQAVLIGLQLESQRLSLSTGKVGTLAKGQIQQQDFVQ